jgi:hypothetical protein
MNEKKFFTFMLAGWANHSQAIKFMWPAGCGGYAHLKSPEIMTRLGYNQALLEAFEKSGMNKDVIEELKKQIEDFEKQNTKS